MKRCPQCGTSNADEREFCTNCGTDLANTPREEPATGPGEAPPPPVAAPMAPPPAATPGAPATPTNPLAIWSLVLGIISVPCCGFITGIIAIVLGVMARNHPNQTGRGMATAGIILGIIGSALGIIGVILWLTGMLGQRGAL